MRKKNQQFAKVALKRWSFPVVEVRTQGLFPLILQECIVSVFWTESLHRRHYVKEKSDLTSIDRRSPATLLRCLFPEAEINLIMHGRRAQSRHVSSTDRVDSDKKVLSPTTRWNDPLHLLQIKFALTKSHPCGKLFLRRALMSLPARSLTALTMLCPYCASLLRNSRHVWPELYTEAAWSTSLQGQDHSAASHAA